jgi:hypothetical protein
MSHEQDAVLTAAPATGHARVPALMLDRRYQLAASFASGVTALAAIRALRGH